MTTEATTDSKPVAKPQAGLYKISRASGGYYPDAPCEGAFLLRVTTTDRRDCDDPKKIPCNNGTDGNWYTSGTNHRIENGQICRDTGHHDEWFVLIPDLMEFADQHGPIIVQRDKDGFPAVTIYDDYIE